ncbi:MAG: serine/threonine-protein kinase [Anaerolineae bacterium]
MSSTLVGQKLGKYQITQLVGHGGMATVYKGYQEDVDRYVAVKVLPPHPGQTAAFVDRFRQEARTIAKLQHPHILPLYDYGNQDDILYLVMPFIDGGSLHDRIRRGSLPFNEIERLVSQIASALDYAHRQGIIHRDIKPDNILMNKDGFALLSDFGIAKLAETSGMTTTGGLVGTPAYIAPEQAQNNTIDGRADIYSFGIVVYEMLTGKQPFASDTPVNIILKQITMPPPLVSEFVPSIPSGINNVIARVLAKNPNDRYQTAGAFADDFKKALQGYDIPPAAITAISDPNRATMRTPLPGAQTPYPVQPTGTSSPTGAPIGTPPIGSVPYVTPPPGTPPPGYYGTPPPGYYGNPTQPPNPTQYPVPNNGLNPSILIGGFAVLAVLLVLVLIVLIRNQPTPPPANSTQPPVLLDIDQNTPAPQTPGPETALPTQITVNAPRTDGHLIYSTTDILGDTVTVDIQTPTALEGSAQYAVWLQNTMTNHLLPLGMLTLDAAGDGELTYTGDHSLALSYDRVFVTVETGTPTEPTGDLVYEGSIPFSVIAAIDEILVTSPDGLPPANAAPTATPSGNSSQDNYGPPPTTPAEMNSSLLDGAIAEAEVAQRHAGLAAGATNTGGMRTHAEHTINILRGTTDDLDGSGQGQNPGRGIGVVFFLDRIDAKLNEAAADAPPLIEAQIDSIRVCVSNARIWMDSVIDQETQMLAADSLEAAQPQMAQSTADALALLDGIDLNQNGLIETFEGECGLHQIADYGVSIANMDIFKAAQS